MSMVKRLILAIFTLLLSANISAQTRVFIIGDSTTETWGLNWYPCMGWGAIFQHFFDRDKVVVDNRGVGGTTTKSYYNEHWAGVIDDINEGDYLFMSFGANDSNTYAKYCTTTEEFIDYIGIFCKAARDRGATPVLLSTVNQNSWRSNGILESSYGAHPQAMRDAAEKYDTPFFDLYSFGFDLSQGVGEEYNTFYRHNNYKAGEYVNYPKGKEDHVHLQETGATDFARYIVESIEKSSDERLKVLADATTPRYAVTFETDKESIATSISRSATFPEGINVTLKSYGRGGKKCVWLDNEGRVISKDHVYVYVMKDHDEHFIATYNDTSVNQNSSFYFRILSDKIIFTDGLTHTVDIYSFSGSMVTSASTQYNFRFNLLPGTYILTVDGKISTKFMIK